MDDPRFTEVRKLVGQHHKLVYEAVKADRVAELPHESQLFAKAMQEHMHLKHVHNALAFVDVREGEPYEITVGGEPVNPLAHLTAHAAVKGQLEQDPLVRAAFEKMLVTGTEAHHAEHVLGAVLFEMEWEAARAVEAGKDPERPRSAYIRKLQKLIQDSAFRKKLTRHYTSDHSAFE
jgi:antitoxin (DNA-binding transcriptional repressor) of toxin-antitoxin stability system